MQQAYAQVYYWAVTNKYAL